MPIAPMDKARAKRAEIDQRIETLAKAVDAERASTEFQAYLNIQARFHDYSWNNCMLIAIQRPDATRIAGYRTWQKLGRQVVKGEKAIVIIAPCPFKRTEKQADGVDKDVEGVFFRAVNVFDVGQTEGKSLPEYELVDVERSADDLLARLSDVCGSRGIALEYADLPDGHYGESHGGLIRLENGHGSGQLAKTLAHELAHETMHKGREARGALTKSIAELEAESVAYVVCTHFGLDVTVRAARYVTMWGGDGKALRASLDRISKAARALIDDVRAIAAEKAVA